MLRRSHERSAWITGTVGAVHAYVFGLLDHRTPWAEDDLRDFRSSGISSRT